MKQNISYIILIIYSCVSYADINTNYPEVINVIKKLDVDTEVFNTIWPLYCNPKWSKIIPSDTIRNVKFTKQAVEKGFFSTEIVGPNMKLTMGETCQALRDYYFDGKSSKVIQSFIKEDRAIKKMYKYSSIDLFKYPDNYQGGFTSYNQPPGQKELFLSLIKRFNNQNVFIVKETIKKTGYIKKDGEFIKVKVPPYSMFRVLPSDKFKMAHKKIKK